MRRSGASGEVVSGIFHMEIRKISHPTVLVVDDEPLIRWSLAEFLTRAGYVVVEAETGQGALDHFKDGSPPVDLVITDLKLPDTDGKAILRWIRRSRLACPVILMTAFGTPEDTADALQLGAYDVLNKPFDLDLLVTHVSGALEAAGILGFNDTNDSGR